MLIYNTRSGVKEELITQEPNKVKAYVCGPTVYDYCHVGHARTYVNFDVLRRYLEATGYEVLHVQNFTDVDDKITMRAREEGVEPMELADRFIAKCFQDIDALNIRRATRYTRASEYIPNIIKITQRLLEKGHAYRAGDAIYFDVEKAGGFGELVKDLKGAVVDRIEAGAKRGPFDFLLWREAREGEESYSSPWGMGRPGWHTECVAMSMDSLGEVLDIHWGGKDLIYPHHECEALMAKTLTGKTFVRYWMHNDFVLMGGEKISKSTGRTVLIHDVLRRYPGEVLRTLLLSKNYREQLEFSEEELEDSKERYNRIKMATREARKAGPTNEMSACVKDYVDMFFGAMDDNLETGQALAAVENMSLEMLSGYSEKDFTGASRIFDAVENILGIRLGHSMSTQ
jgi:cysteinyl-tRNA synthetase